MNTEQKAVTALGDVPRDLWEAQQLARLNAQARQQEYEVENRGRRVAVMQLVSRLGAVGFTVRKQGNYSVCFGSVDDPDRYFGQGAGSNLVRISCNYFGASAIVEAAPEEAVQALLVHIANS